jgi:hypothetical protein
VKRHTGWLAFSDLSSFSLRCPDEKSSLVTVPSIKTLQRKKISQNTAVQHLKSLQIALFSRKINKVMESKKNK